MTAIKNNTNTTTTEVVTFKSRAMSFSNAKVTAMIDQISKSFARRDAFEAAQKVAITGKSSSYAREKARVLDNAGSVARLFLACGVQPSEVIERKVGDNAMFNAKALKKVVEIAQFVTNTDSTRKQKLERVTRAFIASTLLAALDGVAVITNDTNRKFLSSADLSSVLTSEELAKSIAEYQHTAMSGGAPTQSSQARNVLDVLKLGRIESVTKPRDAIVIDATHAFYTDFAASYMVKA